jgi:hypothetical protein
MKIDTSMIPAYIPCNGTTVRKIVHVHVRILNGPQRSLVFKEINLFYFHLLSK